MKKSIVLASVGAVFLDEISRASWFSEHYQIGGAGEDGDERPSLDQDDVELVDSVVVQQGDSLWKIASKPEVYGDPFKWDLLYNANKNIVRDNGNLIFPEQVLSVPRGQQ